MLAGQPPFYNKNRGIIMINTVEKDIEIPATFSLKARSFLTKILTRDVT